MKLKYKVSLGLLFTSALVIGGGVSLLEHLESGVPYKHQIDARKREYMNVTVVDKKYYRSCNKHGSRCSESYELVVDNGHRYVLVSTDEYSYNSALIGSAIGFERSLVDESVLASNYANYGDIIKFFTFMIGVLSAFLGVLIPFLED